MAIKATIFKAELTIADMDRNYYTPHTLTLARHPSETDERMMVRLLAFVIYAHEYLAFGKGIASTEEAALWRKDLTGNIDLWIDLGHPDERDMRKACGRANQVVLFCYGGRATNVWWEQNKTSFERLKNLTVINLASESTLALAALASRNMQFQCTIQDGQIWITDGNNTVQIDPVVLHSKTNFS